eukprot:GHVP01039845.1.p1 GENE.GHVP01039845.1~~GHVP01039845.1.p1  ORF type:complete len:164 (+),score=27.54 GHVP01039845.1:71-562(+)
MAHASSFLFNDPSAVVYKHLKFLITDCPANKHLPKYIEKLKEFGVTYLVRTCAADYNEIELERNGIRVRVMEFQDGEEPPKQILQEWNNLISSIKKSNSAVAVHCVAGLGRAPVLVCVALIEAGMDNLEAVTFVRSQRKGALNKKQYRPMKKKFRCLGCCSEN